MNNTIPNPEKLVIFDFDGTLADSIEAAISVLNEFSDEGILPHFEKSDVTRWRSMKPREVLKEVNLPWWKIPYLLFQGRRKIKKYRNSVRIFSGIPQAIKQISDQYNCVVISTNSKSFIDSVLSKSDLDIFTETVGGGSLFGKHKKITKILHKYKVLPEHAVLVTDEARDIESAKKAGVKSIAVTWGYQHADVLAHSQADAIVSQTDKLYLNITKLI